MFSRGNEKLLRSRPGYLLTARDGNHGLIFIQERSMIFLLLQLSVFTLVSSIMAWRGCRLSVCFSYIFACIVFLKPARRSIHVFLVGMVWTGLDWTGRDLAWLAAGCFRAMVGGVHGVDCMMGLGSTEME